MQRKGANQKKNPTSPLDGGRSNISAPIPKGASVEANTRMKSSLLRGAEKVKRYEQARQ